MRRLAAAVAVILAAASCAPAAPSSQPTSTVTVAPVAVASSGGQSAILAEARRFVFRVRNPACLSTGTAFAFGSTVVTNRHVAAGATALQLSTWSAPISARRSPATAVPTTSPASRPAPRPAPSPPPPGRRRPRWGRRCS